MTKTEIKALVNTAIEDNKLMNVYFRFDANYYNIIPLAANDKLFLAAIEDDFIMDGFAVYRFKDLMKAKIKNDKCDEILRSEGVFDKLDIPDIDISSWQTVFESLKATGENIIVEKQSLDEDEWEFVIGRIEDIYKKFAYVRHFDADGIWQDEPYRIPYTEITNITFKNRYVTVFSKYVNELDK